MVLILIPVIFVAAYPNDHLFNHELHDRERSINTVGPKIDTVLLKARLVILTRLVSAQILAKI